MKLLTIPGQVDTFLTDVGVDRTSFPPADTVAIMGLIALVEIKINNGSGDLLSKKRAFANLLKIGEGESTNDVLKRLLEAALPS